MLIVWAHSKGSAEFGRVSVLFKPPRGQGPQSRAELVRKQAELAHDNLACIHTLYPVTLFNSLCRFFLPFDR